MRAGSLRVVKVAITLITMFFVVMMFLPLIAEIIRYMEFSPTIP